MKKQILLIFCICITIMLQATVSKTVNVSAGGLSTVLTSTELTTVTNLTVTGTIDARDFLTMRNNATALTVIDLSGANITAYTGTWGTAGTSTTLGTAGTNSTSYSANTIPNDAFNEGTSLTSSLTSITIPSSVTSIGNNAFWNCNSLTSITIPSSVTSIGSGAFYYCRSLTSLAIPSSVTAIGVGAFWNCSSLNSINIPLSVTSIGDYTFSGCYELTSIIIPSSVTSIGTNAFVGCSSLTSITIPSSVTSIGTNAFQECSSLNSINIPSSVTSIGEAAFQYCWDLTSIYAYAAIPLDINSSSHVFNSVNKVTCILYVPTGSKSAYKAALQWQDFTNIVEMTTAIPTITNSSISLYPNPIKESFQINGFEGMGTMTLSDLNGKTILSKQLKGNEIVPVSFLPNDIYVIKLITNEGTIVKKVVKE